MAVTAGAVYVDVLPSAAKFISTFLEQVLKEADAAGKKIGEAIGKAMKPGVKAGIEDGIDAADTEAKAAKKGRATGDAFGKAMRREIEAALAALPDVDIDGDNSGAMAEIAEVRAALKALLPDEGVDIDINAKDALAKIAAIRAQLAAISDRSIDIDFDIKTAMASLGNLEREINKRFADSQGSFTQNLRRSIEQATRSLPDVHIGIDVDQGELVVLRGLLEELGTKRIGIDISAEDAIKELTELQSLLQVLGNSTSNVQVRADVIAATATIEAFLARFKEEEVDVVVDVATPNLGATLTRLRAEIDKFVATLPDINLMADISPALREVAVLRADLVGLSASIDIDTDAVGVLNKLSIIEAALEALGATHVHPTVDMDIAGLLVQIAALRASLLGVGDDVETGMGANSLGKISRWKLILTLVLALFPLIAAAILALPALISLVLVPLGAVAAGVDGIKESFKTLSPELEQIQKTTSAAFVEGLKPAIQDIIKLLPAVHEGLAIAAQSISDVAVQIADIATNGANLDIIGNSFDRINAVILAVGPSLQLLTDNMIKLTNIGLQGMVGFGDELTQIGITWQGVIDRLSASGTAQAAVQALFQVLAELLNLIAPLTEFGAVLLTTFGPALAAAISILAQLFSTFAQVIDSLPGPLQTLVAAGTSVGLIMLVLGTRITTLAIQLGTSLKAAALSAVVGFNTARLAITTFGAGITGLGVASRLAAPLLAGLAVAAKGVLAALGGPVGLAITAVVVGLSLLGTAQGNAAEEADKHKAAIQELSGALRDSGGAIDSNVTAITRAKIESGATGEAVKTLGLNLTAVATSVAQGGATYDGLITRLKNIAATVVPTTRVNDQYTQSLRTNVAAANTLLTALGPLRDEFVKAGDANKLLAELLQVTGASMVGGTANAKSLEDAFAKLKDEFSTTADKANALYAAILQLSGQTLPLAEAQGALGESVRQLGDKFATLKESAKNGGQAVLDSSGKFEVASKAGFELTKAIDDTLKSMTNSAAAAFQAAGGMNNLAAAQTAARNEAQFTRDKFIALVGQFGITGDAAKQLADRYGLIPEEVVTLLSTAGIPQVNADLLQINQLLLGIPLKKTVDVGVASQGAITALQGIGAQVIQLPEGHIGVTLNDKAAQDGFKALIDGIEHPKVIPSMPIDLNKTKVEPGMRDIAAQVAKGQANMPTDLTGPEIPKQLTDIQAAAQQAPAVVPATLDVTKVAPQLDAIKATTLAAVAQMPLNPIKGSGWDADLAAIKASVLAIVGTMPLNPIKGSGWDTDIAAIKASVLTVVAEMPLNIVKSPDFPGQLLIIRQEIETVPTVMFIDVQKSLGFAIQLLTIQQAVTLVNVPLSVDVIKSINFDFQLLALRNLITLIPAILPVDVAKALTFDADLALLISAITLTPAVLTVTLELSAAAALFDQFTAAIAAMVVWFVVMIDITAAIDLFTQFTIAIASTTVFFGVLVDLSVAAQQVNDFVTAVQNIHPIITIGVGFAIGGVLGGAIGGVVIGSGGSAGDGSGESAPENTSDPIPDVWSQADLDKASANTQKLAGAGGGAPSSGNGAFGFNPGGDINPGSVDDLRTKFNFGGVIAAMATGGLLGGIKAMSGKIAQVVPPNTLRVIGDRVTNDEAFIPINRSARSMAILATTANRMGMGLTPQATGSFMTQQTGPFATQNASGTTEDALGTAGGTQPLIGSLTVQADRGASAAQLADEVMFRLRTSKYGGLYGGRR